MKRLPWLSVLVVQALAAGPLLAQPINILDRSNPASLSRRAITPASGTGLTTTALLDTDLVLASQAHLPYAGEVTITDSAADKPVLGYRRLSAAATTPNVDPFVTTSLAKYQAPTTVKAKPTSSALSGASATTTTMASSTGATRVNWRLGSRYQPPPSGAPVTPLLPTSGGLASGSTTGLGRGTIFLGGVLPLVGIPEPSTYLLCGMVVVLGGYWHLRRRAKPEVAIAVAATEQPVG